MRRAPVLVLVGFAFVFPFTVPASGQGSGEFLVSQSQNGLQGCAVGWRPTVVSSAVAVCSLATTAGLEGIDRFLLDWVLHEPTSDWTSATFEMTWTASQPAATNLRMIWEVTGCLNNANPVYRLAAVEGPSPLSVTISQARIQELIALTTGGGGPCPVAEVNCGADFCALTSRVFAAPGLNGPGAPADVGFTVQQQFQQTFTATILL